MDPNKHVSGEWEGEVCGGVEGGSGSLAKAEAGRARRHKLWLERHYL